MAAKSPVKRKVLCKIGKGTDMEAHLRTVTVDNVTFVEIRDYIPSAQEYGRGYWVPFDKASLNTLSKTLADLAKDAS